MCPAQLLKELIEPLKYLLSVDPSISIYTTTALVDYLVLLCFLETSLKTILLKTLKSDIIIFSSTLPDHTVDSEITVKLSTN